VIGYIHSIRAQSTQNNISIRDLYILTIHLEVIFLLGLLLQYFLNYWDSKKIKLADELEKLGIKYDIVLVPFFNEKKTFPDSLNLYMKSNLTRDVK
jgi:hypothetical protein